MQDAVIDVPSLSVVYVCLFCYLWKLVYFVICESFRGMLPVGAAHAVCEKMGLTALILVSSWWKTKHCAMLSVIVWNAHSALCVQTVDFKYITQHCDGCCIEHNHIQNPAWCRPCTCSFLWVQESFAKRAFQKQSWHDLSVCKWRL